MTLNMVQVAQRLGVKKRMVYYYVARGWLTAAGRPQRVSTEELARFRAEGVGLLRTDWRTGRVR